MIQYKSSEEIDGIRESCALTSRVLDYIEDKVVEGVSTNHLDKLCHDFIVENGAKPSPLNYNGYPKSICTSINHCVCHGIPDETVLNNGDIVKIDVSNYLNGFHGDSCRTYTVGKTSRAARELIKHTEISLWKGIEAVKPGSFLGNVGFVIQSYVEEQGYSVVREYGGHGIGKEFHEDPHVMHYGIPETGTPIKAGMVFTIEPMINAGKKDIILKDDNWTVETRDKKLSAQFEHTVAVFEDRVEVLTLGKNATQDVVAWRK